MVIRTIIKNNDSERLWSIYKDYNLRKLIKALSLNIVSVDLLASAIRTRTKLYVSIKTTILFSSELLGPIKLDNNKVGSV